MIGYLRHSGTMNHDKKRLKNQTVLRFKLELNQLLMG